MTFLRLVLVTPRYWPLTGETEQFVVDLADGLRRWPVRTTILTARWAPTWPAEMELRETRTVRLPHAPLGGWSAFRYMRSVSRWLRDHREEVDLVYAANIRHDAYAAMSALKGDRVAVVLRIRPSDFRWMENSLRGSRFRRQAVHADALVVSGRALADEACLGGFPRERIHVIPNGIPVADAPSPAGRFAARCALAEVNHSLSLAEYAPLVVTSGPLLEGRHLGELVDAWRYIASRWPSAKLWIVGDGAYRDVLHEQLVDRGLHHQIVLPGSFDDLSDVFQAADAYVAPAPSTDGAHYVLQAMAAGLPVIAVESPEFRDVLNQGQAGRLVPAADRRILAEAITELLEDPRVASRLGQAARIRIQDSFSPQRMWQGHLELFEQVIARKLRGTG